MTEPAQPDRRENPPGDSALSQSQDTAGSDLDPTLIRNQPALRTSSGLIWIIVGGLLALACLIVLVPMTALQPGIAWFGAITVIVLYVAILITRLSVPSGRMRLLVLAVLFGAMALVALVCVFLVSAAESTTLNG